MAFVTLRFYFSIFSLCLWAGGCFQASRISAANRAMSLYHEKFPTTRPALLPGEAAGKTRPEIPTLTLELLTQLAIERDSELITLRASVDVAKSRIAAVTQWQNPEFRLAQVRLDEFGDNSAELDFRLRVKPPRLGEIGAKEAAAWSKYRAEKARLEIKERQLKVRVQARVWDIFFIGQELVATGESIEHRQQLVDAAVGRADTGLATRVEVSLAELVLFEAKQDKLELIKEQALGLEKLFRGVGLPGDTVLDFDVAQFREENFVQLPDEKVLIEVSLKQRSELEIAAARIEASRSELFIERGKMLPWISFFQVGYEYDQRDTDGRAWTAGIGIELPLFSLNLGEIQEAQARTALREKEFNAEVNRIILEVQERYREVVTAQEVLLAIKAGPLAASVKAATTVREAMEAGQVDLQKAAFIEDRHATITRRRIKALRHYYRALNRLREAVSDSF